MVKEAIAAFLDTADDYLGDGYHRERPPYQFRDGAPPSPGLEQSLESIASEIQACAACRLGKLRRQAVPGEGAGKPLVMIIGEAPGADEDATGRPFVGAAGQLLDKMLASIGLFRDKNCFIANMVKCRPPGNRDPAPDEIAPCAHFLQGQMALLAPAVILCLGRIAAQSLLRTSAGIGQLRGRWAAYTLGELSIPFLPTYHPSALLRDASNKAPAFQDLKTLMIRLAALDSGYAVEVRPLMQKYAASDAAFASAVQDLL
jgi:DNA polymerase